jgi:hypothetical protein
MRFTPKSLAATALTVTICIVLIMMFVRLLLFPPGTILDATRDKMFQLVTFIAGIVSGWVLYGERGLVQSETVEERKKSQWTAKTISGTCLTFSVCVVIILVFLRFMLYPPGTVPDETRDKMFQLVTFIAGIVSGWILYGEHSEIGGGGGEK